MAIKLHAAGAAYARERIKAGEIIHDDLEAWNEDAPSRDEAVRFLNNHSIEEYGQWFLAVDTDKDKNSMQHYIIPHGDFSEVHRCALELALKAAEMKNLPDIERSVKELLKLAKK
jgi:hypothetical protein